MQKKKKYRQDDFRIAAIIAAKEKSWPIFSTSIVCSSAHAGFLKGMLGGVVGVASMMAVRNALLPDAIQI